MPHAEQKVYFIYEQSLTTERVYKKAVEAEEALAIMREGRDSHFDPRIFDYFMHNFKIFTDIRSRFAD